MVRDNSNRYWTLIIILLIAIIITGSIIAWAKYSPSQPVEISMPQRQELRGEIYISGAVANPGFYPLAAGDTVDALIKAAGGTTSSANLTQLKLYVSEAVEKKTPQKIDLNRAEAWLLQALPGIGENRAQAIINHRNQNGPFGSINELIQVQGVGASTYEQIKHLISVADE